MIADMTIRLEDLYTPEILALTTDIRHLGRLPRADASACMRARICGSRIHVMLALSDGRITAFAQELAACALAQASAAILSRHVVGAEVEEMFAVRDAFEAMIHDDGPAPEGVWSELEILRPVHHVPQRHESVLLPFRAVCRALEDGGLAPASTAKGTWT